LNLSGRVAIVTGGGTGLGRALAIGLADAGAAVVITYSASEDEARVTVGDLRARSRGIAVRADVADWDAAASVVATTEHAFGEPSILVNNAGITKYVPLHDLRAVNQSDWQRILDVNVGGAFAMVRAVAPQMRATGMGSILNVTSTSALTHDGSSIPYVVSKGALATLTHVLARALAPEVRVNAVAPAWMPTRWLDRYLPEEQRRLVMQATTPPVDVDLVVQAALGLIAADGITGQVLAIDNGEVATLGLVGRPTQDPIP
jgi:3-oxoacyl-[acyl-carrier protein] reductase